MKFVHSLMEYPARWTGAVGTTAGALYVVGGAFSWWHWTADQATAVTGLTTAVLGLITAIGVHNLVTPNVNLPSPADAPPDDPGPPPPYAPQIDPEAVAAAIPQPLAAGPGEGQGGGSPANPEPVGG